MPQLKVIYFPIPVRAEPTRLALSVGGIKFEDSTVQFQDWGPMKAKVNPLQLPLLEVDGNTVSQSMAIARYACKLAMLNGKPLYPEDPYQALLVDELVDKVNEFMAPLGATFVLEEKERAAKRAEMVAKGGVVEKWMANIDSVLAKSTSGFAVGDSLTMADLVIFLFANGHRSGTLDGVPKDSLDHLTHLKKHRDTIANIPQVNDYYKDKEGPVYAPFKA
ncbi:Glutathione S-transferase 1 [Diplonema papillatum]|nr:Glutathione S-transferase 1 [Diplonema papillatum]KAJ9451821.1 Glutathione S-transferase 1 [Diplonema papillatum]